MWKFDTNVKLNYNEIVNTNIPHYNEVIEQCLDLASTLGDQPRIVDCGCANLQTLKRFQERGFKHLTGIESSVDMLPDYAEGMTVFLTDKFIRGGTYDLILANWVLHFIPDPKERMDYIEDAYNSLAPGGYLVISDKIDNEFLDQYHWWKHDQGLSPDEIQEKHESLEGVLVPLPLRWYTQLFDSLDAEYSIINAHWCFNTFILRKTVDI